MRTFKHFPDSSICPFCQTNNDEETILIPISDSPNSDGNCVEAQPFHTSCLQKSLWFYKEQQFVIARTLKID